MRGEGSTAMPAKPFVSIVVPVYNEEALLADTLTALQEQDYGPYEIVVVDNACTDHSPQIARSMGVRVVTEPRKGVVHALRAGFAAVQGEIVALTDGDTRVPRDWLSRLVANLTRRPDVVAAGGIYAFYDGPLWLRYASLLVNRASWQLIGANMAVWRWAYESIGGLNPNVNLGWDAELGRKLRRRGRVVVDRRLVVRTSARRFQVALWRTWWRYFVNDLWLIFFGRPLFYDFADIRTVSRPQVPRWWPAAVMVLLVALTMVALAAMGPTAQAFGPGGA
jgi:glycosyltransferase involved in cell wall biosynthesis